MSANSGYPGNALEDRLRGLIINNAVSGSPALQIPTQASSYVPPPNQRPVRAEPWPPHLVGASFESQQEYLVGRQATLDIQNDPIPAAIVGSPPGGRKRPNQAQRRQMNSQLSLGTENGSQEQAAQIPGPKSFGHHHHHQSWNSPASHGPPRNRGNFHGHAQRGQHHHSSQQSSISVPYSRPFERVGQASGPQDSRPISIDQNHSQNSSQPWNNSQQSRQPRFGPPGQHGPNGPRQQPQHRQLYQPGGYTQHRHSHVNPAEIDSQAFYLDKLVVEHVPKVGIEPAEIDEKESFRCMVERLCQEAITEYEEKELGNERFITRSVELKCFGSMASGFATKASDMDLAFLSPLSNPVPESSDSPIPRILEKKLLDAGLGARLLTRTRVPIIKLCQNPSVDLYEDLKNERLQWESGGAIEGGSDVEDLPRSATPEEPSNADGKLAIEAKIDTHTTADAPEEIYKKRLSDLKQGGKQSIGDYYGNAKKLLFKLGGRDVGLNGVSDMSEDELKILQDVSNAFLEGLHDEVLRASLSETYSSLYSHSAIDTASPKLSLSGVFCQAEGDRLVLAWEDRPLQDSTERLEVMNQRLIEDWRILRQKTAVDVVIHNKQLHNTLDRLKRISSLQLVFLEQGSHESPSQYQARASRIIRELCGTHQQPEVGNPRHDHVLSLVKVHYVNGISNSNIKEQLTQAVSKAGGNMEHLFLYHRVLHLADDYARALKSTLYDEHVHSTIEEYITAIRKEPSTIASLEEHLHNLRSDPAIQAAVVVLKGLPDPTTSPRSRDRYSDRLEFPKTGVGIQCDINFTAQLGLHNTLLLRCYSSADPRVRPLALFVKSWAKTRGINTPYRGTLSSYGYVLMVLHYLINVANPFVLPNLQHLKRPPPEYLPPAEREAWDTCQGYDVGFWRNELEIKSLADRGMLNHNHDSLGKLLRGFFEYYAQNNMMSDGCGKRGFEWGREVLSLRTLGGILTKQDKGWVGARTTVQVVTKGHSSIESQPTGQTAEENSTEGANGAPVEKQRKMSIEPEVKEIRHRYLFAIEDPFEITHNVARTVTHNGIVSIRDEFRRAWRIIRNLGDGDREDLLADLNGGAKESEFVEFLELLHGNGEKASTVLAESEVLVAL